MYTRNQVSRLTLCKFTKVLPFLYWMLWDKKLLTKLKITFASLVQLVVAQDFV
jgi:hypothetical protein